MELDWKWTTWFFLLNAYDAGWTPFVGTIRVIELFEGDESALGKQEPTKEPRRLVSVRWHMFSRPHHTMGAGGSNRHDGQVVGETQRKPDLQAKFLRIGEYKNWYVNNNIEPGFAGG